jgi:nickel superoxide dismutase
MTRTLMMTMALATLAVLPAQQLRAHCEVPCGIYADEHRFEAMLEDTATIAKAITQINEITAQMESALDGKAVNQVSRWVATKESHATNTQHIIAQYFMTQRIKPGTDDASQKAYVKKLTAAHAVMVAAMKCKQDANPDTATALRAAILDFYRAYEGKEPQLHD